MTDITTLSPAQLVQTAQDVLAQHFDWHDASVTLISFTHHAVFDVRSADRHYILHLYKDHVRREHLLTLAYWLRDFETATGYTVARVAFDAGEPQLTTSSTPQAALYRYLAGETRTAETVSLDEMHALGRFLAAFHAYSAVSPPADASGFVTLDWDGLFGASGVYQPTPDALRVFSADQRAIMAQVTARVRASMDAIGRDRAHFGIIHGDLLLKNVLFDAGRVHALDWEYCGWGYYLYDLTPVLWMLKPHARYAERADALLAGYTRTRPLADTVRPHLETLIAARQVASMRWVAANQHNPHLAGKVSAILDQRTAELRDFLQTGILRRA